MSVQPPGQPNPAIGSECRRPDRASQFVSGLKPFDIGVETYKDVIQLSRFVNTDQVKTRAGHVASGVRSVQNTSSTYSPVLSVVRLADAPRRRLRPPQSLRRSERGLGCYCHIPPAQQRCDGDGNETNCH